MAAEACFLPEEVAINVESRSKAAILWGFDGFFSLFSGSYRPIRRVAARSGLSERSDHAVRSFGFCEAGLKKLATAFSKR